MRLHMKPRVGIWEQEGQRDVRTRIEFATLPTTLRHFGPALQVSFTSHPHVRTP